MQSKEGGDDGVVIHVRRAGVHDDAKRAAILSRIRQFEGSLGALSSGGLQLQLFQQSCRVTMQPILLQDLLTLQGSGQI